MRQASDLVGRSLALLSTTAIYRNIVAVRASDCPWEDKLFRFKKFSIDQTQAAMKVGFDGILLGAWACVEGCRRVLDVGTGTGLIALMLAQRTERQETGRQETGRQKTECWIDAVEIDAGAASDALRNFERSPWHARLQLIQERFQDWANRTPASYDLIVSNPPFFPQNQAFQVDVQDSSRERARQHIDLDYQALLEGSARLLRQSGRLCLIFPADQYNLVVGLAARHDLTPHRTLEVRPIPEKPAHRVLIEFRRDEIHQDTAIVEVEQLTIERSRHVYTDAFKALARDFYLAF